MPKTKTVEIPVTVLRWLATLAEDALDARRLGVKVGIPENYPHPSCIPSERMNEEEEMEKLIDSVGTLATAKHGELTTSFRIAAGDMDHWLQYEAARSGLSWMQVCGIAQTLTTCRADARLGPGGLHDLDVIEELVHRNWKPSP